MTLTPEKKGLVFKMLATKPLYETGVEFGFDKHYKDVLSVKNAVYRIYQKVRAEPDKYGVNPEIVPTIVSVVSNRNATLKPGAQNVPSLREKQEALENVDIKELILDGRNKAIKLLHRKMDLVGSSKKKLDEVNLSTLAQVFGIIFDKSQIIRGESTENIAVLAKIDKNMNPDEALSAILKMREINQVDKDRTNKPK